MKLQEQLHYLRREHGELLRLANRLERTLERGESREYATRACALADLRAMEHGLSGIVQHCHIEDRIIESAYHRYLDDEDYQKLGAEHETILRILSDFREDLKFATGDLMTSLAPSGRTLIDKLRGHVAFEEDRLDYIDALRIAPDELLNRLMHSAHK